MTFWLSKHKLMWACTLVLASLVLSLQDRRYVCCLEVNLPRWHHPCAAAEPACPPSFLWSYRTVLHAWFTSKHSFTLTFPACLCCIAHCLLWRCALVCLLSGCAPVASWLSDPGLFSYLLPSDIPFLWRPLNIWCFPSGSYDITSLRFAAGPLANAFSSDSSSVALEHRYCP